MSLFNAIILVKLNCEGDKLWMTKKEKYIGKRYVR